MTPSVAGPVDTGKGETDRKAAGERALPWRFGGIQITGEGYLTLADTLNPDMQPIRYQVAKVGVGRLDSQRAGVDTPLEVLVRPDRYPGLWVAGTVRLLDEALFA